MTNVSTKKTATAPITSDATPFDLAIVAAIKAQDAADRVAMTFAETLDALRVMGVDEPSLKGKHGKTVEGAHYEPARRAIGAGMFTKPQFKLCFETDDRIRDKDGAFTKRGDLVNRVNSRLARLRKALVASIDAAAKAATAGKSGVSTGGAKPKANNGAETDLKIALDRAAVAKKLMGEAKTEAQTQAKALRVDVQAVHAAWVQLADTLIAIHGKHGGGKN